MLYRPWSPFVGYQNWPSWVPNPGLPFSSSHLRFADGNFDASGDLHTRALNFEISPKDALLSVYSFQFDTVNEATTSRASKRWRELELHIAQPWLLDELAENLGVDSKFLRETTMLSAVTIFSEDTVPASATPPKSSSHRYRNKAGLKEALEGCFKRLDISYENDDQSIFDILRNTIVSADDIMNIAELERTLAFTVSALSFRIFLGTCKNLDLWGIDILHFFTEQADGNPVPSFQLHDRTLFLSRFFTTCSGYVGVALGNVRPGGKIYIVPRCPIPVVLRPSARLEGAWELLGGVYIPGVMHGEAVNEHREWGGALKE
jgi:hypothetical protein